MPPPAAWYSIRARPQGVLGGSAALEQAGQLEAQLDARGDVATADGALAATALGLIREARAGRPIDGNFGGALAQRCGFPGDVHAFLVLPPYQLQREQRLHEVLTSITRELQITRYGVAADAGWVAVLVGGIEATLDDFPRTMAPGATLTLSGSIPYRFKFSSVYAMYSDGSVQEFPMSTRRIDARLRFETPGVYRVQIQAHSPTEALNLINVPILVGVPESELRIPPPAVWDPGLTSERAEAEILKLLSEARRRLGIAPFMIDSRLRSIALEQAQQSAQTQVLGGAAMGYRLDERVQRAVGLVSLRTQFVVRGLSPTVSVSLLLDTPSDREALIEPLFTHIGIGTTFEPMRDGTRQLWTTLLLVRIPPPEAARQTATTIEQALRYFRKISGAPPVRTDPLLAAAAAKGLQAALDTRRTAPENAAAAANLVVQAEATALRRTRFTCSTYAEVVDHAQVISLPHTSNPNVEAIGVAAHVLETESGPRTAVVVVFESASGKALECK